METPLDWWLEPQRLQQKGDMDCGVAVIEALANLSREQILRDIPEAVNGITADQMATYLNTKLEHSGREAVQYRPNEEHPLPCAHLIAAPSPHWIYQAENGGIHDPSAPFQTVPPKLVERDFSKHYRAIILTIAIRPRP